MRTIEYTVVVEGQFLAVRDILEMLRYSGTIVRAYREDKHGNIEIDLLAISMPGFDTVRHQERQAIGRWESFGCQVKNIKKEG